MIKQLPIVIYICFITTSLMAANVKQQLNYATQESKAAEIAPADELSKSIAKKAFAPKSTNNKYNKTDNLLLNKNLFKDIGIDCADCKVIDLMSSNIVYEKDPFKNMENTINQKYTSTFLKKDVGQTFVNKKIEKQNKNIITTMNYWKDEHAKKQAIYEAKNTEGNNVVLSSNNNSNDFSGIAFGILMDTALGKSPTNILQNAVNKSITGNSNNSANNISPCTSYCKSGCNGNFHWNGIINSKGYCECTLPSGKVQCWMKVNQ